MTRREKLLGSILLVTAAAAAWSTQGFPFGGSRAAPVPFSLDAAHACPPGFEPSYDDRRLAEVPPGEIRPAALSPREQCVSLASSTPR